MTRLTFSGAVFLTVIAVLPSLLTSGERSRHHAQFFGGTSLLIIVGVYSIQCPVETHLFNDITTGSCVRPYRGDL